MDKIKVFHFHNGTGGGVLSVIRNLLRYRQHTEIENHVIYTINKEHASQYEKPILQNVASEQIFYYSPKWNFYYTCRQLAKLIPDDKAVIVAHDWLELGMVSNLGLKNTLIHLVHGAYDYYYNLALVHCDQVDSYLCVSNHISAELKRRRPDLTPKIFTALAPVPTFGEFSHSFGRISCAYFVRDLTDPNKQFLFLPQIDQFFASITGKEIEWFVAGGGMTKNEFYKNWHSSTHNRVHFFGEVNESELAEILSKTNVVILPSIYEGLPISIIEAMLAGNVPIVGSWANTADKYITDQVNGFIVDEYSFESFALSMSNLILNKERFEIISNAAKTTANQLFNPEINTKYYEGIIFQASKNVKQKKTIKVYGSRLDHPLIPNFITNLIRSIL